MEKEIKIVAYARVSSKEQSDTDTPYGFLLEGIMEVILHNPAYIEQKV
jgi:hypothetical protein